MLGGRRAALIGPSVPTANLQPYSSADAKCIEKVLPAAGWRAANASMMQDLVLLPCIVALFALHCVNWLLPPAGSNVNTPRNAITPASWSA